MIKYILNAILIFLFILTVFGAPAQCPYESDPIIKNRIKKVKELTSFISKCGNDDSFYMKHKKKCYKKIKKQPKVTAIVPVYNVGPYIKDCINSLRNQTLKNIEIIAVDDGSTDNSGRVLNKLQKKDKRLVVVHVKNAGVSCARNLGLDLSTGEYIAFIDGDDFMHKMALKTVYNYAMEDNVDFITYKKRYYRGELPDKWFFSKNINTKDSKKIYRKRDGMLSQFTFSSCNALYKADIIRRNNIRLFPYLANSEDGMFNIIFLQYINTIKHLKGKFYSYRLRREGQATRASQRKKFHGVNGRYGEKHLSQLLLNDVKKRGLMKKREHIFLDFLFYYYILRRYRNLYFYNADTIISYMQPYVSKKKILKKCNALTQKRIEILKEYAKLSFKKRMRKRRREIEALRRIKEKEKEKQKTREKYEIFKQKKTKEINKKTKRHPLKVKFQ